MSLVCGLEGVYDSMTHLYSFFGVPDYLGPTICEGSSASECIVLGCRTEGVARRRVPVVSKRGEENGVGEIQKGSRGGSWRRCYSCTPAQRRALTDAHTNIFGRHVILERWNE